MLEPIVILDHSSSLPPKYVSANLKHPEKAPEPIIVICFGRVISDKDKKLTAYHEAGHAVVSKFLPTQTEVKEVSIIPRGLAGGYTMYKTNEDKYYVSRTELLEKMVALMGGRAAEKLALNEISTGASNDIEVATGIAKDMLTVYGMDDKIGPISLKVDDPYELQIFGDKVIFRKIKNFYWQNCLVNSIQEL